MMFNNIKILIVEDEAVVQLHLQNIIEKLHYKIIGPVNKGKDAILYAAKYEPDLILMDIRLLDNISGIEAAKHISQTQDLPIIFMTAYSDVGIDKIIESNPYGYLSKPLDDNTTTLAIELALHKHKQSLQLKKLIYKQENLFNDIIIAIANITEQRDPYTAGHQVRVSRLATRIAENLGLSQDLIKSIYYAGYIHDIGKIAIPGEYLTTTKKISDTVRKILEEHVINGYDILKTIDFPWPIAKIVLQHHERLDGSGYPYQLKKDEILLEAQIISVADVCEAMIMPRPYREKLGKDDTIIELEKNKNILYNGDVTDIAIDIIYKMDNKFNF